MKPPLMIWPTVVLTALFLPKSTLVPRNEFTVGNTTDNTTNNSSLVTANALLLNDKPLAVANFSMASSGILTMVASGSDTNQVEKIPFRVYLLRKGRMIGKSPSDPNGSVLKMDITPVLAVAKPDDYLLIESASASNAGARRSIKLKPFFNSDLFDIFKRKGAGC